MSRDHVIDDLANRLRLYQLFAWAREYGPVMPIGQVRRIAYGTAAAVDINQHGTYWVKSLLSLAQRTGLGCLERDGDGELLLRFAEPLPDDEQVETAWEGAFFAEVAEL